jgi:hypothetical protein
MWDWISSVPDLVSLLFGGSVISIVTWKFARRKAAAEAKEKEAEAKSAEVELAQKIQDTYQEILEDKQKEVEDNHRLISELREDRDHYKKGYVEMRNEVEKLSKDFYDFKQSTIKEREKMKSDIARNTRIAESSRPFMCGLAPDCSKCVPVIISDEGTVKPNESKHEIEPIEPEAL